jgi:hypothetical protein
MSVDTWVVVMLFSSGLGDPPSFLLQGTLTSRSTVHGERDVSAQCDPP